jgi:hypothetical protein
MYTILVTKIEFDRDRQEEHRFLFRKSVFEANERLIEESEYDRNSKLEQRKTYRYDESGNLVEEISFNARNELIQRHILSYENSLLVREVIEYSHGKKYIKDFSFTDLGLAEQVVISDENGSFQGREVYVFDEKGNMTESFEIDEHNEEFVRHISKFNEAGLPYEEQIIRYGELESRIMLDYDSAGNAVKSTHVDGNGAAYIEIDFSYDEAGRMIAAKTRYPAEESETTEIFEYDDQNNLLLTTTRKDGKLVFHNACAYENNRLVSEEIFEIIQGSNAASHRKLIHVYEEEGAAK